MSDYIKCRILTYTLVVVYMYCETLKLGGNTFVGSAVPLSTNKDFQFSLYTGFQWNPQIYYM